MNPKDELVHAFISDTDPNNTTAPGVLPGVCGDGECRFTLPNPEPGIARISLSGATENGCRISARVDISSTPLLLPDLSLTADGGIVGGDPVTIQFPSGPADPPPFVTDLGNAVRVLVPVTAPGSSDIKVHLEWDGDWSHYPTNDLDVFVEFGPFIFFAGFTLDSPEVLTIPKEFFFPTDTSFNVIVSGFDVNTGSDPGTDSWRLRVTDESGTILPGTILN